MPRVIQKLNYEAAARQLDEADNAVEKALTELQRSVRRQRDALANLISAVHREAKQEVDYLP